MMKEWLTKISEKDVSQVREGEINLKQLWVLEQEKAQGAKESCGYHSLKNALEMTKAFVVETDPSNAVSSPGLFNRFYGFFQKSLIKQKKPKEQDLSIPEAIQFLEAIENGREPKFGEYTRAYQSLQHFQQGIPPLSIFPVSTIQGDLIFNPEIAPLHSILTMYQMAKSQKNQAFMHSFIIADSTFNRKSKAGHWLTLSLLQDETGKHQWLGLDSSNINWRVNVRREVRFIEMINSIFEDPDLFITQCFDRRITFGLNIRAKYIDKKSKSISKGDKELLLSLAIQQEQHQLISDAINMIDAGKMLSKDPQKYQETIENINLLIEFYLTNAPKEHQSRWENLQKDWKGVQKIAEIPTNEKITGELTEENKEVINNLLGFFCKGKKTITDNIQTAYYSTKSEIGFKGHLQKLHAYYGAERAREGQIEDLARLIKALQNENELSPFEKGAILTGYLETINEEMLKSQQTYYFKSRFLHLCQDIQQSLEKQGGINISHAEASVFFRAFQQSKGSVKEFRMRLYQSNLSKNILQK